MINSRHSANGAPCREEILRNIHHRGEALGGQIAQAGEETTLGPVDWERPATEAAVDGGGGSESGGQTSTSGKPSPRISSLLTSHPSHMASSANRAGRSHQGEE